MQITLLYVFEPFAFSLIYIYSNSINRCDRHLGQTVIGKVFNNNGFCLTVASLREELTPLAGDDKGFPQAMDPLAMHTDEVSSRPSR